MKLNQAMLIGMHPEAATLGILREAAATLLYYVNFLRSQASVNNPVRLNMSFRLGLVENEIALQEALGQEAS